MVNQILIEKIDSESFFLQIREILKQELAEMQPETGENLPDLMTRQDTAKYLHISLVALNDWTKKGILTSYNLSGKVFYKRAEILQALRKNKRRR